MFGRRLDDAISRRGSVCVGIDPHDGLLNAWGLPRDIDGLTAFAATCAEAFADTAAVVKPQSAFFERYGSAGIAVLEQTVRTLREGGALVLLDVKRGDIDSTMWAYADAYLDRRSPIAVDAITASPFLGVGSLDPAFSVADQNDAGVFVLALTSNKEGPQFQHACTEDGRTVAQTVVDEVADRNLAATPMGPFGLVVGATIGDTATDFTRLNGPILSPGIGAQGGTADDVRRIFGDALPNVLPSISREVLGRGPTVAALRAALNQRAEAFGFLRA